MKTKFVPATPEPKWIRLPRSGDRCPFSGLARSMMDQMVRAQACNNWNPPVESRIVRAAGKMRGVRLVSFTSLMAYLNSLPNAKEGVSR